MSRPRDDKRAVIDRVMRTCLALPDTVTETATGQHHVFRVRRRTFAYYLHDHHGDGRVALCVKAAPGEQARLIETAPERFFSPAYLGPRGWVGLRLDLGRVDWAEVGRLVRDSYSFVAPPSLARLI